MFINSCPHAGNHAIKKVDLSFGECECPAPIKLNRSWQLELLDHKSVYIMKAIPLAAALFWDPLFAACPRHNMKLISKLELKMRNIASGVVKEIIESVWINATIRQLDQLFRNNSESWTGMAIIYAQPSAKVGKKKKKKKKILSFMLVPLVFLDDIWSVRYSSCFFR